MLACPFQLSFISFLKYNTYPAETGRVSLLYSLLSELGGLAREILLNHKGNLKGYCVVEFTKVKSGELSDLFESVYKGVSMYEELS